MIRLLVVLVVLLLGAPSASAQPRVLGAAALSFQHRFQAMTDYHIDRYDVVVTLEAERRSRAVLHIEGSVESWDASLDSAPWSVVVAPPSSGD